MKVEPDQNTGGYNPSTGDFDWTLSAALQAFPVPMNSDAVLNATFTIIAYDNSDVIVTRQLLSGFTKIGGGTCDSSAGCQNSTTLLGAGDQANGVPFQFTFISAFDLRLSLSARALEVERIGVDATGYGPSSTTAVGTTYVYFTGVNASSHAVENVTANVELATVATPISYLYSAASHSVSAQTTFVNHSDFVNSPTSSTAAGAYLGLRGFNLSHNSGVTPVDLAFAGCGNFGFSTPGGTTGRVQWQDNYYFTTPYDASSNCRVGWLP